MLDVNTLGLHVHVLYCSTATTLVHTIYLTNILFIMELDVTLVNHFNNSDSAIFQYVAMDGFASLA